MDDSGGAGLKARIRVLRETPHAEAREDSYARVSGAGLVYDEVSSLSVIERLSNAATASSSELRPPISNALAALAKIVEPSPPLVFGRWQSASALPEPAMTKPSLAVRLGINRSPASARRVIFAGLDRNGPFFREQLFDGVCPMVVPVPVKVQSEIPSSRCLGECLALAIFDFGESRYANLELDLAKYDDKLPYMDCEVTRALSVDWQGGVKGEEWFEVVGARLVVRVRGDGVRGIRPPAVRVENMPWWLFKGVDIVAVAIVISVRRSKGQSNVSIEVAVVEERCSSVSMYSIKQSCRVGVWIFRYQI